MAKLRGIYNDKTIEKRIKEGRGFGEGKKYLPWITTRDFPSQGRCSDIRGWKTNRVHNMFSDLETRYFYTLEYASNVIDIREQFPLFDDNISINETMEIAEALGINYPIVPNTNTPNVQTTDFLLSVNDNGKSVIKARTVKYSDELTKERSIEKLEIERIFWERRGVDWKIVTERDIDLVYSFNVEFVHNAYSLNGSNLDAEKVFYIEDALLIELSQNSMTLSKLTQNIDKKLGLPPGESLFCIKHLIANKKWQIDMKKKINTGDIFSPTKISH